MATNSTSPRGNTISSGLVLCDLAANTVQDNHRQHVHLIPIDADGMVRGVDGRAWQCVANEVIAQSQVSGLQLAGDYFHASLQAESTGAEAPASGWIDPQSLHEAQNGDATGIWGTVEWTPSAAAAIQDKEYRYVSPVFALNASRDAVVSLKGFGLTHYPNLPDLTPVANATTTKKEDSSMDELIERLRYLLNLPTLANEADILAELEKFVARLKTDISADAADAKSGTAKNSQSLHLFAMLDALAGQVKAQLASNSAMESQAFVPRLEFDRLRQELQALATAQSEKKVELAVNAALEHGVIAPASLAWATDYCKKDPEGFAQFAANSVKVVPLGTDQHANTASGQTLNAEEIAVCSQLGVSTEDFLKSKASEEH